MCLLQPRQAQVQRLPPPSTIDDHIIQSIAPLTPMRTRMKNMSMKVASTMAVAVRIDQSI
jgi:hypothetical protein